MTLNLYDILGVHVPAPDIPPLYKDARFGKVVAVYDGAYYELKVQTLNDGTAVCYCLDYDEQLLIYTRQPTEAPIWTRNDMLDPDWWATGERYEAFLQLVAAHFGPYLERAFGPAWKVKLLETPE